MDWENKIAEQPFIRQLETMGWTHIQGNIDDPASTGRDSFTQVLQEAVLRERLLALNLREDAPWLDEARINEAVAAITRIPHPRLIEANQHVTHLLQMGLTVEGLPGWDGGRGQTIQYIDWELPENNQFTVINQYRVDCPPGHDGVRRAGKAYLVADLVLLVNGIPLVVVEAKDPAANDSLAEAVDQLRRYSNQRRANNEVEGNEGNETLFFTNQLLIVTNFDEAKAGAIGALFEHFIGWHSVSPAQEADIASTLGVAQLSGQQRLVAGMLSKINLLDIVHHFTLFSVIAGQSVKFICRYQQFRAVNLALQRLRTGDTRIQDGEHDRRGGIIWHTQGSGKSLTMVFLVHKLRSDPILRSYKVVVITDRKDLQRQLVAAAKLTGEVVEIGKTASQVEKFVRRMGPGLVFATIQKYRDADAVGEPGLAAEDLPDSISAGLRVEQTRAPYPVLNEDAAILVLVDEAHRTQAGDLHAKLMAGMPNCARIGFTGTPIIMGAKKRTHEIFGEFIDRYSIKESERDGATVPVLYEGRTVTGAIKNDANMDQLFEDMFCERSAEELEAIKLKYATKGQILEAPLLIADKARDMLRHYVTHILPNGFKAQVVAYSRLAAVRYIGALELARTELLTQAAALSDADKAQDDEALAQCAPLMRALVAAWRERALLQALEFATVISAGNEDDPVWAKWTDGGQNELRVERFKKPLPELTGVAQQDDQQHTDPLAILVVKSMLLTGFDAPVEAAMYLDRPIKEAELLQAVARVNRTWRFKRQGLVVDYYGIAQNLKKALAAYADEDIEGALKSLKHEIPALADRHTRVMAMFRSRDLSIHNDADACVELLAEPKLRAQFSVNLKAFLHSLDAILPRPEALPFTGDAKVLAHIYARARNRYKDTPVLGKDVGAKVRRLIDAHLISLGIDTQIAPIVLTDANFAEHIARQANDRAKASEMEHALRSHIRKHLEQDPVRYRKLSERLNQILQAIKGQWQQQVIAFGELIKETCADTMPDDTRWADLPAHYLSFVHLLQDSLEADASAAQQDKLRDLCIELVDMILAELSATFWEPHKRPAQEALGSRIFALLRASRLVPRDATAALKDRILDLARANHERLLKV